MVYEIIWEESALKQLRKLEDSIATRILKSLNEIKENLYAKDVKKLKGHEGHRLRVGDYRIIFELEGNILIILKVGHRQHIYER